MLITDNSKGTSDGKERDQLQAMVAVGSEFITHTDPESTVQKSGEFVRIEKDSGEAAARFLLLHETSQTYDETWNALTGNELRSVAPNVKLRKRSRLYVSEIDPTNGDLPFREIGGFKAQTRISRYHSLAETQPYRFEALTEANYTSQAGKRRLFAPGNGKAWLVREINIPSDTRFFNDSDRTQDSHGHTKKRGLRAARVEVVEIDPVTGSTTKPIFSFDVHSGLGGGYPGHKFTSLGGSTDMWDSSTVYVGLAGVLFGSAAQIADVQYTPIGGDASDTYAVAEPATAKKGTGEYTSIVAVYPASDDVYDSRSSGPYRLTCKYTTPQGDVATTKITFPAVAAYPAALYWAARGMSLHRTGPNTLVLRADVHAMRFGASAPAVASQSAAIFLWSYDNGATWGGASAVVLVPYGGVLVKDKDTLLTFSWDNSSLSSAAVDVRQVTNGGWSSVASIPRGVFNQGLMAPTSGGTYAVRYVPLGFGGATYKKGSDGKKHKRLWMQFDPYWAYEQSNPRMLAYPGSRPMLMVSDDGGVTWARRFLPTPWSFRAGFVVAISETELAVPIFSTRQARGYSPLVTIYVSGNGGDSWKATAHKLRAPGESHADGNITPDMTWTNTRGEVSLAQDFSDSSHAYNRGELLPMLALRDKEGRLLPANPARPWMNDHKIKEPDYA